MAYKKLNVIQQHDNLNTVYRSGEEGPGGAYHEYFVQMGEGPEMKRVLFQRGPRTDPASVSGVLDNDLLEIVRDRLTAFQAGPYRCRENACALHHVEEALMWMAQRAYERKARGVLGTEEK